MVFKNNVSSQLAEAVEYDNCIPTSLLANECPDMTLNCIWWWSHSSEALKIVEYLLIAITPRSTVVWSGSTC